MTDKITHTGLGEFASRALELPPSEDWPKHQEPAPPKAKAKRPTSAAKPKTQRRARGAKR